MIYNTPLRERLITKSYALTPHGSHTDAAVYRFARFANPAFAELARPALRSPHPKRHRDADLFLPFPSLSKISGCDVRSFVRSGAQFPSFTHDAPETVLSPSELHQRLVLPLRQLRIYQLVRKYVN